MYTVKTLNKISGTGLSRLDAKLIKIDETAEKPDALIVRSVKVASADLGESVLCVARAGAGYNNIEWEACAERGIVVFNTPGANANGVTELVICGLLMSSRDVPGALDWVKSAAGKGDEVAALAEKEKSAYTGPEIRGKTLGLLGLGAIGARVAKAAKGLGMAVYGYDPYLSASLKAELANVITIVESEEELYGVSDYLSLHVPYNGETKGKINAEAISKMKSGVRVINTARGEIVNDADMLKALVEGKIWRYVTDFPNGETAGAKGVIAFPHIGASTPESEENCAVMAAEQVSAYLLWGEIRNCVNLPNVELKHEGGSRALVIMKGGSAEMVLSAAESFGVEVSEVGERNGYSAVLMAVRETAGLREKLEGISGAVRVRVIE